MPYQIGGNSVTKILKQESHKLFEEFEVGPIKATITFSADLIASNVINGSINGVAITAVTYASSHTNTMNLLKAELEAHASVKSVVLSDATNNRQLTVYGEPEDGPLALTSWAVTAGSTQATTTTATDTNTIHKGQPVQLQPDGTIEPCINGDYAYKNIGWAIGDGVGGELVTVMMRAHAIVFMECATDGLVAGPVTIHSNGFNTTTEYLEVDDASVTVANLLGWALDAGDNGDVIRVALQ